MVEPHPFARRVATMLATEGFLDLRLEDEVQKALWRVEGRQTIPFDISYLSLKGLPHREYVECKEREGVVAEKEVAKFIADLELCAIEYRHGIIVSNSGYQPLGIDYARNKGIQLYTVAETERPAWHLKGMVTKAKNTIARIGSGTRYPETFMRVA